MVSFGENFHFLSAKHGLSYLNLFAGRSLKAEVQENVLLATESSLTCKPHWNFLGG